MAILSWGKPKIQFTTSTAGVPNGEWKDIDTPKQDTTKLATAAGSEVTALEEGGEVIDSRTGKNSYSLEFDLFVKKGVARPFADEDGVIPGEYAFRVIPEDPSTEGALVERASVRVEENYSSADGKILHYVVKCLKPATGRIVKPFTLNGLKLSVNSLYFGSAADNTGKTITATSTEDVVVTKDAKWLTATTSGKVTTIKVTANDTGKVRKDFVTITADGKASQVEVTQIPQ